RVLWWNPRYPTYRVPNVAHGTQICFRASISPFTGQATPSLTTTSTGWRYSGNLCFTVINPSVDCGNVTTGYVGQNVSFSRTSGSTATGAISWSGGGTPATAGNVTTFTTAFSTTGTKTITISQGGVS